MSLSRSHVFLLLWACCCQTAAGVQPPLAHSPFSESVRTFCSMLTSGPPAVSVGGSTALGALSPPKRSGCRHTSPSSCSAESLSAEHLPIGVCTLSRGLCTRHSTRFDSVLSSSSLDRLKLRCT